VLELLNLDAGAPSKVTFNDFSHEGDWSVEAKDALANYGAVSCAAVTPDGRYALTGGYDPRLILWDLEARTVRQLEGHTATITAVAVSPNGRLALSGSENGEIIFWSLPDGALRHRLWPRVDRVTAVAFSADGRLALEANAGGLFGFDYLWPGIQGWDLTRTPPAPTPYRPLPRETAGAVVFAPDGRLALVGRAELSLSPASDKPNAIDEMELWDLAAGAPIRRYILPEHGALQRSRLVAAFTPDGRQVVTARQWVNIQGETGLEVLRWRVPSRFERWALGTQRQ
jgi:WD40 repeat protein